MLVSSPYLVVYAEVDEIQQCLDPLVPREHLRADHIWAARAKRGSAIYGIKGTFISITTTLSFPSTVWSQNVSSPAPPRSGVESSFDVASWDGESTRVYG